MENGRINGSLIMVEIIFHNADTINEIMIHVVRFDNLLNYFLKLDSCLSA